MKTILYQEEQFYPKHYLVGFALFIGLTIYFFVQQHILNTLNSSEMPMLAVISSILVLIMGFIYLAKAHFSIKITDKDLQFRYGAFYEEKISVKLANIKQYEIIEVPFLAQLNGENVQFNTNSHTFGILNNKILKLTLKNGEKYSFGVQNTDMFEQMLP